MPESVPTTEFTRKKASHAHPRLLESLEDNAFYPMTVTIQTRIGTRTATGGWSSPGTWDDVLVDIPCRRGIPTASERRSTWGRVEQDVYAIALNGYYPQIHAEMRAVTSDGIYVDIRGVTHDSDDQMTVLDGRTVDPGSEGFL
jgi:hypothetical protein